MLEDYALIDLTHEITEKIPVWPGDPKPEISKFSIVEKDGYNMNVLKIGEHTGTHFGVPLHFFNEGKSVDEVPVSDLILSAVKIDISDKCSKNPDYVLKIEDVLFWEKYHGKVPEGSFVIVHTGWYRKWGSHSDYLGLDEEGKMHFPGFSKEVVVFLMDERKIKGLGIDTHGVDPGMDEKFEASKVLFERGGYHLENLTNLSKLPSKGFYIFIGALPIERGTGSPARVIALVKKYV